MMSIDGSHDWPFDHAARQLTYQCDYVNPTGRTITSGSSPATDELCMAITYFFPATGARICVNNGLF
jgi:hypothetical protein